MEPIRNPGESAMSNCARRAEIKPSVSGAGDIVATVVWQNIYSDAGARACCAQCKHRRAEVHTLSSPQSHRQTM
jgi:hypothetical protein